MCKGFCPFGLFLYILPTYDHLTSPLLLNLWLSQQTLNSTVGQITKEIKLLLPCLVECKEYGQVMLRAYKLAHFDLVDEFSTHRRRQVC